MIDAMVIFKKLQSEKKDFPYHYNMEISMHFFMCSSSNLLTKNVRLKSSNNEKLFHVRSREIKFS